MKTKIKVRVIQPYKNLENKEKIERLKAKLEGIFTTFGADDFSHPITSKTILVALNGIIAELYKVTRK